MAQTIGLVQKLIIMPELTSNQALACVWIGPTPANAELLMVNRLDTDSSHAGAFKNSIVDALVTALVSRREVVADHGDSDALITSLTIEPA